ncbi:agmatinase, mitochondrial [Trichonephila inaurata madagascariensis]|uniref:Agmatinase, mitochondrial n=1 Tax=Trichonephila inaurata madagascariensis TaxID=2747483 RepID=A0A8X7CQ27_9ARAC|nr:agmatinase, mitochondrial [Trichonephila inaurata madagascariensis]
MFTLKSVLRQGFSKNFFRKCSSKFNQPIRADVMPQFAGIPTFMRLPYQSTAEGLDVGIIGIPMDIGASNRTGTRFGPRQIRTESSFLSPSSSVTGAEPFSYQQIADLGDIPFTLYDIRQAVADIKDFISKVLAKNCIPITLGGDHTITYPILQAMKEKHGPVGLVLVDAHADICDTMMGCKISHETPFKRAFDDGALDPKRVVQIGLRGTTYTAKDYQWGIDKVKCAQECIYNLKLLRLLYSLVL